MLDQNPTVHWAPADHGSGFVVRYPIGTGYRTTRLPSFPTVDRVAAVLCDDVYPAGTLVHLEYLDYALLVPHRHAERTPRRGRRGRMRTRARHR